MSWDFNREAVQSMNLLVGGKQSFFGLSQQVRKFNLIQSYLEMFYFILWTHFSCVPSLSPALMRSQTLNQADVRKTREGAESGKWIDIVSSVSTKYTHNIKYVRCSLPLTCVQQFSASFPSQPTVNDKF